MSLRPSTATPRPAVRRTRLLAWLLGALILVPAISTAAAQAEAAPPTPAAPLPVGATALDPAAAARLSTGTAAARRALVRAALQHRRQLGADRPRWSGLRSGSIAPVPNATAVALDSQTQTLYVTSDDTSSTTDTGRLDVLDARTCRADRTRCRGPVADLGLGEGPQDIVVDEAHQTAYVALYDRQEVAVVDLSRCTARRTDGCRQQVVDVPVGRPVDNLSLDPAHHTLYLGTDPDPTGADPGNVVGLLDTTNCNGHRARGCGALAGRIPTSEPVFTPYVATSTGTLYLPGPYSGDLTVYATATCNAVVVTGCSTPAGTVSTGGALVGAALDPTTSTLYVTDAARNALQVVDTRRCRAADTTGCATAVTGSTPAVPVPFDVVLDVSRHTAYARSFYVDLVTAVDLRRCRADDVSGCGPRPRALQTESTPFDFILNGPTLYVADLQTGGLQVLDVRTCNATALRGCRREAPTAPGGDYGMAFDPVHRTLFENAGDGIRVIATDACRVDAPQACAGASRVVPAGFVVGGLAADPGTDTLYAVEQTDGSSGRQRVVVIDSRTCTASATAVCTPVGAFDLPFGVGSLAVDSRSHTVYATFSDATGNSLAVLPGRACNAHDQTGCSASARFVPLSVGQPSDPYVSEATSTVYVTLGNTDPYGPGLVDLIPTRACDQGTSACAVVATTGVGSAPVGSAEDPATHTLYVAARRSGSVSVIDTSRCNAGRTSGCGITWPSTRARNWAFGVSFDASSRSLFVLNQRNSTVSVVDTRHCNATDGRGCARAWPYVAVGYSPDTARADRRSGTLYVLNSGEGTTSLIDLRRPCRTGLCERPLS